MIKQQQCHWCRMNEIRKSESFTNLKQLNSENKKKWLNEAIALLTFFLRVFLLLHFLHWIYKIAPQGNLTYTALLRAHSGTWLYHHHFNFVLLVYSFRVRCPFHSVNLCNFFLFLWDTGNYEYSQRLFVAQSTLIRVKKKMKFNV